MRCCGCGHLVEYTPASGTCLLCMLRSTGWCQLVSELDGTGLDSGPAVYDAAAVSVACVPCACNISVAATWTTRSDMDYQVTGQGGLHRSMPWHSTCQNERTVTVRQM